ncbi:unnamed protein product [Protopolystoma xenopodis]|uniref:Uncharacterized protein n=1 Tax=Protopolystoma xenopodis TaxID=117903 RepID=A0A448X962_9PLAT|nr:unnamed protein product [Protopolystoma xenopodis]
MVSTQVSSSNCTIALLDRLSKLILVHAIRSCSLGQLPASEAERLYPGLQKCVDGLHQGISDYRIELESQLDSSTCDRAFFRTLLDFRGRLLSWLHLFAFQPLGRPGIDWQARLEFHHSRAGFDLMAFRTSASERHFFSRLHARLSRPLPITTCQLRQLSLIPTHIPSMILAQFSDLACFIKDAISKREDLMSHATQVENLDNDRSTGMVQNFDLSPDQVKNDSAYEADQLSQIILAPLVGLIISHLWNRYV